MFDLGIRTEQIPVCVYDHRKNLLCVQDIHERECGLLTLGDLGPTQPRKERGWYMWQPDLNEWESLKKNQNGEDQ